MSCGRGRVSLLIFLLILSFFGMQLIAVNAVNDSISQGQEISRSDSIVSAGGMFELGFFSKNSKDYYVGIWYKNIPVQTIVWVANRDKLLTSTSPVLTINNEGNLVIVDGNSTYRVSENSLSQNTSATLLDSGNFVLRNGKGDTLWQSFDYPTDTLLPYMKLGWDLRTGLERYLTSWRSADDPSPGNFTYRLDISDVLPQLSIFRGSTKTARSGPWNGVFLGGIPVNPDVLFESIMVQNSDEFYYSYEPFNNPVAMQIKFNHTGISHRQIWKESSREWDTLFSLPNDQCEFYGNCGANGFCNIEETPVCECLEGFVPKSQHNQTSTCTPSFPPDCKDGDRFIRIDGVRLPDLIGVSLNESMSLKDCETECLKNCSCRAYASSNINGTGCLIWYGDLIDMRKHIRENEQDIYIRVPASLLESDLRGKKSQKRLTTILVSSIVSSIFVMGLVSCIIWKRTRKTGQKSREEGTGQQSRKEGTELPLFDLSTIATATNNFSEEKLIGSGGFGPVYKGDLSSGEEIAVKRLAKTSGQGIEEFRNEVILIARLQHRNLVGLLGSCIEGEERMLIYEYMPNKSLDYFIFDKKKTALLTWQKRFDIIMGIARGLLYLHQDSKLQIIHRDLKASNILLDNELKPKISDFGLARIFQGVDEETRTERVVGTYGYMSPEYTIDGTFSVKSDVFSFGVLLLEIVSGKKNRGFSHPDHYHNLLGHAWLLWKEGRALELIDSCLEDFCVKSQVIRCVQVGLLCVQMFPEDRPAMSSAVFMLANMGVTLPQPKQPGFFAERSSHNIIATSDKEESHTGNAITISMMDGR